MRMIDIDDPDALERAAAAADADGDREHARDLRERAKMARRQQREADAGVRRVSYNFPESWMR